MVVSSTSTTCNLEVVNNTEIRSTQLVRRLHHSTTGSIGMNRSKRHGRFAELSTEEKKYCRCVMDLPKIIRAAIMVFHKPSPRLASIARSLDWSVAMVSQGKQLVGRQHYAKAPLSTLKDLPWHWNSNQHFEGNGRIEAESWQWSSIIVATEWNEGCGSSCGIRIRRKGSVSRRRRLLTFKKKHLRWNSKWN